MGVNTVGNKEMLLLIISSLSEEEATTVLELIEDKLAENSV